MSDEQKQWIIDSYNRHFRNQLMDEDRMDRANSEKSFNKACDDHSFALGAQEGIVDVLDSLGYKLIREEEHDGLAIDIVKEEAAP